MSAVVAEVTGLVVTNSIKLGGLGVILHEIFAGPTDPRTKVLAVSMVMMAGAQGLEAFFTAFFKAK